MTNKTVLSDAQIAKGRESIFSTDNPYCPCDRKTMLKAARWAEQAVLQSPEIQQLRKEADRYQYLRGYKGHKATGVLLKGILFNGQEPSTRVDEVMDAAMEAKP